MSAQAQKDWIKESIAWLEKHRMVNLLLIALFTAFILFMHSTFVELSIVVMNALTLPVYNLVVAGISMVLGLLFLLFLIRQIRKKPVVRNYKLFFLLTTIALIALHYNMMFEMNIEIIHSLQFAVLSFLIFPLFRRFGAAVILGIPVMFLDEWYQYQVLFDYVTYFDFNDVLMDILGAGLLMCALWIGGVKSKAGGTAFWQRFEFYFLIAIVVTTVILIETCFLAEFSATKCENTWLILNTLPDPHQFWQVHPLNGSVYHVMTPLEGLVVISVICLFYVGMDWVSANKQ